MTPPTFDIEAILADASKRINRDIAWTAANARLPVQQFEVEVVAESGPRLFVTGWLNSEREKLNYNLFALDHRRTQRRIFAFNSGTVFHRNPSGERLILTHVHRWTDEYQDRFADPRPDLPSWNQPLALWLQFCSEANITHRGQFNPPEGLEEVQA